MSDRLPEVLDAWRMAAARRQFQGRVPLSAFSRLRDQLVDAEGEAHVALAFDCDASGMAVVDLQVQAELPLQCQRSLQRFVHPVDIRQRLGLIRDEADEAALPPGCEALLLADDGRLEPLALAEDELILALPLIPVAPGTESVARDWAPTGEEQAAASPFAALAALKRERP